MPEVTDDQVSHVFTAIAAGYDTTPKIAPVKPLSVDVITQAVEALLRSNLITSSGGAYRLNHDELARQMGG